MTEAKYEVIDGIKCYSPTLAVSNLNFKSEGFEYLYGVEENNFWFKSRNNVITQLFKKYLGTDGAKKILEIGCGTGFVLKALSEIKNYNLTGAEIYLEGLRFARKRLENVELIQLDATNIPFENEYDAIGAFDVIEHIEEDELVIKNVLKALKVNGKFFVTVPQYQFLWNVKDEIACHKRRYSKAELVGKIKKAGFEIEYVGSFVTALFPLMCISRLFDKSKETDLNGKPGGNNELELNSSVNKIFESIMKVDEFFIKSGASLPFGGSLILVAKK